jgi:hypothetical protein
MKTKTKILSTCILLASMLVSFGYASWSDNLIPVEEMYNQVACTSTSKIYLNQDNDGDGLWDVFFYLNNNFMLEWTINSYSAWQIMREHEGTTYTKVKYFTPLQNMLYKISSSNQIWPIDDYTFWRASWVFPYHTPIRWIATTPNKVIFEQPSDNDTTKNTISIVYDYRYKYAVGFDGTSVSSYRYNQIPNMAYMGNTYVTLHQLLPWSDGNRKRSWSSVRSLEACRNYNLNRCGDGTINTYNSSWANQFTGEVCDDGPNNGLPWYCNATCSGTWSNIGRCGDEIIQEPGTTPYIDPVSLDPNGMSFEECDDGDEEGDTDGLLNGDDPAAHFCSSICLPTFAEEFTEEFVN